MDPLLCVGALIRDDSGRIFVQRRSRTRELLPGAWDIVGGHVEPGETHAEALTREVMEETGWTVSSVGAVVAEWEFINNGIVRRETDYMVGVAGDLEAPRQNAAEHDAHAWVGLHDLDAVMNGTSEVERWMRDIVSMAIQSVSSDVFRRIAR